MCYDAKGLRSPGYYKWYAPEKEYLDILNKLNIEFSSFADKIDSLDLEGNKYYCIYLGIAEGQPVIRRIGIHLHDSFESSTLRKSIAALLGKEDIAPYMDLLKIEIICTEDPARAETKLLSEKLYVLNIQKNKVMPKESIQTLRKLRTDFFNER